MKLPAFQFYVGDWRKDPGVQSLSFHDRGVWFEMICLMHESEHRGKLVLNGRPMPEDALARMLGLDNQILTKTITTLLTYGVASLDEDNQTIVCRRMIRDEELRKIRKECGKMGGNPNLVKQKPTSKVKQKPTPSSSSSISSSEKEESGDPKPLTEGQKFAQYFYDLLDDDKKPDGNWRDSFAKTYDELTRLDKLTKDEIKAVCEFGTEDHFWKNNFTIPSYLRKKSKTTGLKHFVQIRNAMNATPKTYTKPPVDLKTSKL